jgi:hypothetical protein
MLKHFQSTDCFLRCIMWGCLVLIALFNWIAIKTQNIAFIIDQQKMGALLYTLACAAIAFGLYPLARASTRLEFKLLAVYLRGVATFLEANAAFGLYAFLCIILSYIAATSSRPFYDAELMAIDRFLQFDWVAYVAWVNENPTINKILSFCYHSFFQFPLLFLYLTVSKQTSKLYAVLLCFILSLVIVILFSAIFPAVGPFTYLNIDHAIYKNVYPQGGGLHVPQVYHMRDAVDKIINASTLRGIIEFPSFHTCVALILIWGFWGTALVGVPFLIFNSIMLIAIPVTGEHYLADVLAGALITLSTIWIIKRTAAFGNATFGR